MTEVEELIDAATKYLKNWHLPRRGPPEHQRAKPWNQILEDRTAPKSSGYKD